MKLMRALLFIIPVLIIFNFGCSSTKEYYIEPEFKKEKISSPVLVVPVQRTWFNNNFTHTFGSLSGTGKSVFYSSLEKLIADKADSRVKVISSEQSYDGELFKQVKLNSGKDSMQVMLPIDDTQFNSSDYNPRIVLLLDQFYYRNKEEATGGLGYAGHESKTRRVLYFETKYTFWDTQQNKPVAWGNTFASTSISNTQPPNQPDYLEVLNKAVEKLVKQGPIL